MGKTEVEIKILNAAKLVFIEKGLEATSMTDIAKKAGVSRTSLHYYFRTKESLFHEIYKEVVDNFMPKLGEIIRDESPAESKVCNFIEKYVELLHSTPLTPNFIINEIYRNPKGMADLFMNTENEHGNIAYAINLLEDFKNIHKQENIDSMFFCLLLYSQCVFPFLILPILKSAFFENNPELYKSFIERLKQNITKNALLSLGITNKKSK